jgi:hypothetical protein
MNDIFKQLSSPFQQEELHFRPGAIAKGKGSALALVYIDARVAHDRFNEVMGFDNWKNSHICYDGKKDKVVCEISLRINGEWITKSDGAGDTDIEGEKGSFSDAFKRAAVMWGVGRYLYKCTGVWVPFDENKRIFSIPNKEIYLRFKSLLSTSRAIEDSSKKPSIVNMPVVGQDGKRNWKPYVQEMIEKINLCKGFDGLNTFRDQNKQGRELLKIENPELDELISIAGKYKFESMKKPKG